MKKLLSALLCFFVLASALPCAAEDYIGEAYNEALLLYPDFFTKIKSQLVAVDDSQLLVFVNSVYDCLKEHEAELDIDDFDSAVTDAVLYAASLRKNMSVRSAFVLAYPEVLTDGLTGEIKNVFSFLTRSFIEHGLITFTPFINLTDVSAQYNDTSVTAEFRNLPENTSLIAAFYDSEGSLIKAAYVTEKGQTVSSPSAVCCKLIALCSASLEPVYDQIYIEF